MQRVQRMQTKQRVEKRPKNTKFEENARNQKI